MNEVLIIARGVMYVMPGSAGYDGIAARSNVGEGEEMRVCLPRTMDEELRGDFDAYRGREEVKRSARPLLVQSVWVDQGGEVMEISGAVRGDNVRVVKAIE